MNGPPGRAPTVHEIRQQKRLSTKHKVKRKVKFAHQLHRLTKLFLPSFSGSRPASQVPGSVRYRSPSPFPKGRLGDDGDDEIEGQPQGHVPNQPSPPTSPQSVTTSMWGPSLLLLPDGVRCSSCPPSQGVQARREVKVTALPTSEACPQTATVEQMRKSSLLFDQCWYSLFLKNLNTHTSITILASIMANDKTPLPADTNPHRVDTASEKEDATVAAMIQQLNPHSSSKMPAINTIRPLQYLGVNQDDISFHSATSCGSQNSNQPLLKTRATQMGWLPLSRRRYSVEGSSGQASFRVGSSTTINTGEAVADSKNRSGCDAVPRELKSEPSLPSSCHSADPSSLPAGTSIPSPVTYSAVAAVNEAEQPQKPQYLRGQNNLSQESIVSVPISRQSLDQLPSPALPLDVPTFRSSRLVVGSDDGAPLRRQNQSRPKPRGEKRKLWWARSKSFFEKLSWPKANFKRDAETFYSCRWYEER